jgi:hypothetical protein
VVRAVEKAAPDVPVLGRIISLNAARITVVCIGPAGFSGEFLESPTDMWIPATMQHEIRYRTNKSAIRENRIDQPCVKRRTFAGCG